MSDPFARLDATSQADLVRRGEVSPRELIDAAIARIERIDPQLNAVVSGLFEEARAQAARQLPDGPLRGVPFLMKDLGATQAGQPYWAGSRVLRERGHRARHDSYLGARLRATGLVAVGKASTPEFGLQSITQPLAFGATRNPWDLALTPGGSSGGSCAAVAAGLVPLAHANDGAGSIRIPAGWCGLVGLKPSRGRVAIDSSSIGRSFVGFAVTRSVRDTALLLDAVQGHEPGDLFHVPPPRRAYASELERNPRPLRIGLLTAAPGGETHAECRRVTEETGRLLESLGHRVELESPPALFDPERGMRTLLHGTIEYRMQLRWLARLLGRPVEPGDVEPFLWTLADPGGSEIRAEDYLEAAAWEQSWATRVAGWWSQGWDLLLTPTVCEPAPRIDELAALAGDPWQLLARLAPHMAFTEPFSATGQPAISLPLGWSDSGMPLGVQLVAEIGREDLLLRVAAQLERARPWEGRRPALHA